jgi:RNA polymerase sigma factor (sigma-70 family)
MVEASTADVDLVAAAQRGDVEAYAELVRRYQALAVGLAAVVTRDPANAEDVAQEGFLKAYYALDRFRPGASFRAWLTRIVVNEARNALAASRRRAQLHTRVADDGTRLTVGASAELSAVANEQHGTLLAILDAQREDDRAVLLYRYVLDLSEAEMAEALGCSPGTVKSRLSRALARLRADLDKVAPLLAVVPNLGTLVGESLSGAAGPLPASPARDLAAGIAQRIAAGGGSSGGSGGSHGSSGPTLQQVAAAAGGGLAAVALVVTGFLLSTSEKRGPSVVSTPSAQLASAAVPSAVATPNTVATVAAPPKVVVVYGSDLTDAQRQELGDAFKTNGSAITESVSRDELQSALRSVGLTVDGSERAISSAAVTCLDPGGGLSARTENVTQMPAAAYANALVTAGITDAAVIVAAPPSTPMTGETAFVGVLKAYPLCHPGQPLQAERRRVAYAQLHVTSDLALAIGAWDKAAAIMLRSSQVAFASTRADETALGAAVDDAASAEGVPLDPALRSELVAVLNDLAGLDHGTYAHGFTIEQVGDSEVRVVPAQQ